MRCGKGPTVLTFFQANLVATRTNALWQSSRAMMCGVSRCSRNPHECAVAKIHKCHNIYSPFCRNPHECAVAKGNAVLYSYYFVSSQPARMRCGKDRICPVRKTKYRRNPHECAVAKGFDTAVDCFLLCRNPHECAVAKRPARPRGAAMRLSQPARMRCGKETRKTPRGGDEVVATRTNALWQSVLA